MTRDLFKHLVPVTLAILLCAPAAWAQPDEPEFSAAELDQMLAPIALYPDVLLSQILIAATYPLEVVQAARWSRRNPGLEGEDAVNAVTEMDWDPSVKALVAFPRLLERMSEDLDWTTRLGEAYLYQESDVVGAIQALRDRAYAAGHLETSEEVRVYREREVIYIEPAQPRVVYVPWYQPTVVYGRWWWPSHPPVYWAPPPRLRPSVWVYWGAPVRVSPVFYYSAFDWHRRHIVVLNVHLHRHRHVHVAPRGHSGFQGSLAEHLRQHSPPRWQHDPSRRRGVGYRHPRLAERYAHRAHDRRAAAHPPARGSARGFAGRVDTHLQGRREHARGAHASSGPQSPRDPGWVRRQAQTSRDGAAPQSRARAESPASRTARPGFQTRIAEQAQSPAARAVQRHASSRPHGIESEARRGRPPAPSAAASARRPDAPDAGRQRSRGAAHAGEAAARPQRASPAESASERAHRGASDGNADAAGRSVAERAAAERSRGFQRSISNRVERER